MSTPSTQQPPPEQAQPYPGRTAEMDPRPNDEMRDTRDAACSPEPAP